MSKDDIKAKLDEAGIEYDARLGEAKLAALLPAREDGEDPKGSATIRKPAVTMRVLRNYWPGEEDIAAGWPQTERRRVVKGTLVDLDADAAMDALEAGIAARVRG